MATTWAVLLPSRGPAAPDTLAAVLPLGAFLGAVAFLLASPLVGAPLAACAPRLAARAPSVAFGSVFGFAGWPAFGSALLAGVAAGLLAGVLTVAPTVVPPFWVTGSPSTWMRAHTRLMAVLRSVNFLTGVTPGRRFQMARSLSAGHWAARSASSCWLAKESNGVVVTAAASSGVANTLMLFSLSMVKIVIFFFLGAALCAVTT